MQSERLLAEHILETIKGNMIVEADLDYAERLVLEVNREVKPVRINLK